MPDSELKALRIEKIGLLEAQAELGTIDLFYGDLERVHIFQVKTSLKFFDKSEKKIRTASQAAIMAS